ncbi:MAG: hypothetical protein H8E74_05060 [Gammaproteobacteria bacterium]|nr:hypothetical protein [Gammaproteobacteria bacterium]
MRNLFFDAFKEMMKENESLFFLTSDTGYNLVEPLLENHPDRALNIGVAEANMIGVASGLANIGFIPVCYAITNFISERCFEQIRNDLCYHNYQSLILGTSTGFDNAILGSTHHVLDDIGVLKTLPNINIYSPSGISSLTLIVKEAMAYKGPSYIRITKGGIEEERNIDSPNHFLVKSDSSMLVISHGKMTENALHAHSISPIFSIFAMDRIKPLQNEVLDNLFKSYETIIVIEDNFSSGLYNSICQWSIEERSEHHNIISFSVDHKYDSTIGDSLYLDHKEDLSPKKISERIVNIQKEIGK